MIYLNPQTQHIFAHIHPVANNVDCIFYKLYDLDTDISAFNDPQCDSHSVNEYANYLSRF